MQLNLQFFLFPEWAPLVLELHDLTAFLLYDFNH
jgi:hypothetical protein